MRRLAVFFIAFSFYLVFFTQPVAAQYTCCDTTGPVTPEDYKLHCDACGNTLTKNAGDSCGTNANCKSCSGSRIYANICAGSGGGNLNMCDLFKMSPSVTVQAGKTSQQLEVLVKQGAYSKITLVSNNGAVAQPIPASWGKSGLPDLGQNYTVEHKYFNVNGLKAGTAVITASQYATYPGYEMLYCSASMTVTVTAPTPVPTPTAPPVCSCGPWANGACRTGGCADGSYPQTRTCTPNACAAQTQCVKDPACIAPPPVSCDIKNITMVPYPDPTDYQHTGQFKLTNNANQLQTFNWILDNWTDNSKDQFGTLTLQPGETKIMGLGKICSKWQLDIGCAPKNNEIGAVVESYEPACTGSTPPPTPTPTPTPLASITSRIETDPSLSGGEPAHRVGFLDTYCASSSQGTAYTAGRVSAFTDPSQPYNGSVSANGSYTISKLPSGVYTVKFTPTDPNIMCTCPLGCEYQSKTIPTTQDLKFYVSPVGKAWYQTSGGDVAAQTTGGVAVSNTIPATCVEPLCGPFLSVPIATNQPLSIGALLTTTGAVTNLSSGSVGKAPDNRLVKLPTSLACTENYNYFYRLYSMGLSPTIDFLNPGDAVQPKGLQAGGKKAYYYAGNLPLTISRAWSLSSSDSIVVFVNSDLEIKNTITVPKGGFLAFIVAGKITISPEVGTTTHSSVSGGQVQGVYIANGTITVEGGGEEKKLIGEGTFAACNGIKIDRDYQRAGAGLDNNLYPGALFLYRPDFVLNTPERMRSSSYIWKEVNP